MVRISGSQNQDRIRGRLLKRLEQAVLRRLRHPLGVRQQGDAHGCDERLQAQELLQRLVVRLRTAFRMEADLIDADGLATVILPIIGVNGQAGWLTLPEEELLREGARERGLSNSLFAGEAVGMRQATGPPVRLQNPNRALVPRIAAKPRATIAV